MVDLFIDMRLRKQCIDLYFVRSKILLAINENLENFSGAVLDIGCGSMPYRHYIIDNSNIRNYIGVDLKSSESYQKDTKPDIYWDGVILPIEDNTHETAISTEVLEHVPKPDNYLSEVFRILKPGGLFFFTTPFLWPLHDVPYDEWRLTPFSLERLLKDAGFKDIELKALGGWHASMAQMLGLWIKRAPMHKRLRSFLLPVVLLVYKRLLAWEVKTNTNFRSGAMITGIYGTARK
jgi:SAM-dependent methyltransferase